MKTTDYWYSKVFIVIVLALVLIPSVTFAAWYNPFTWSIWSVFKKSDAPVVVQVETISTSSPSVSTSTEPKKDVAPETQKKTIATTPVQPKAEPVVQVVDNTEVSENLAAIKSNVLKIVVSRNTWIADLNEDRETYTSSRYSDEYVPFLKVLDFVIAELKSERDLAQMISDTIDATPLSEQANNYDNLHDSYTSLLNVANATNEQRPFVLASLTNLIESSDSVVKARIEREVINEFATQYGGSGSSVDFQAERARLNIEADAYIKNISDTQAKLRGNSKEKVETYLKAIIYSPIGNQGWLNSR